MMVAIIDDETGRIIGMKECKRPNEPIATVFDARDGKPIKQSRRIIKGCEGKSHEYIAEHMRAKHDLGNGYVELEDA